MKRLVEMARGKPKLALLVGGAAVLSAGLAVFLPSAVVARGPNTSVYANFSNDSPPALGPIFAPPDPSVSVPAPSSHKSGGGGKLVCVRLCDGAFFPVSSASRNAGSEATCSDLCPDAPTALYREPGDKIEDATSAANGAPYTALPVALRYRDTLDATCTCHRSATQRYAIDNDPTLRKGDVVMTANGFVVFEGASHMPYAASDFTALAKAPVSRDQRATLTAMERVSEPGSAERSFVATSPVHANAAVHVTDVSAIQRLRSGVTAATN